MTDMTPHLGLPYILAGQAQKEVTHNEALNLIDAALQLAVLDRDLAVPPSSPGAGARYLVAAAASGAWAGKDGQIACWNAGWQFLVPAAGWSCWVADEGLLLRHDGAGWATFASTFGLALINQTGAAEARTALGLGGIATRDAPAGAVVGTTDAQTLSGKTLDGAALSGTTELGAGHAFSGDIATAGGIVVGDAANSRAVNVRSSSACQLRLERNGAGTHQAGIEMFDASGNGVQLVSSNNNFSVVGGGTICLLIRGPSGAPQMIGAYATTTAASANLVVDSSGDIKRATSSERHKAEVEPIDPAWSETVVYGAEPIWYRSRCPGDPPGWSWWGLSAEREARRDARMVLWRGAEPAERSGREMVPDGIHYPAYVPHLIVIAQRQHARIAALEARLAALEAGTRS